MGKDAVSTADANEELGFKQIRDRFLFKRNLQPESQREHVEDGDERDRRTTDRQWRGRSHLGRGTRKGFSLRGTYLFYGAALFSIIVFVLASMVLQNTMMSVFRQGSDRGKSLREGLKVGGSLKFMPFRTWRRSLEQSALDRSRMEPRIALHRPRLAIILGKMKKDPSSMMLFTVLKSLKELGYSLKIFAGEDGEARQYWEQIGGQLSILSPNTFGLIDWSIFEGIIVSSLEAKELISSLMQDPFCSIPLIWIIDDDTLAKRFPFYVEIGWEHLVVDWRNAFSRADAVVFSDFSLPMLYSMLDAGNFLVVPGSSKDVWSAESYAKSHSKYKLREEKGLHSDDIVVLVVGSSFFYDNLSWDYAVAMHAISPLLMKFTRRMVDGSSKFIFLCGNSSDGYNEALLEVASRLGLPRGSLMQYGLDSDVNSVLLMADIVLHGSFQDEQGFPPLLLRAMSFEVPVIVPDLPVINKYVVDGIHGLIFQKHNPDTLLRAFSLLVSGRKLSKYAHVIASAGKLLAKNMLASECISGYAKLLENVINFPSDVSLPHSTSQLQQQNAWEWNFLGKELEQIVSNLPIDDTISTKSSVVYALEEKFTSLNYDSVNETNIPDEDIPTHLDWDVLRQMEISEDFERREMEELEQRMEKTLKSWDEVYRNARKAEKLKFELNERDEGEIERIGQPLCIYEIYTGAGAWPFLHHGSLYRGLSLSKTAQRSRSDDVDAVSRLPLLNDTYYKDLLCELGGMFSIANRVDNVHTVPWIGFQSWRATGRKVSLSEKAEKALEETINAEIEGDVIYYWAPLELDNGGNDVLTFWSLCDILNGGRCRTAFEDAFRRMYGLPLDFEALPPMPEDGGYWSALHSWIMPTPSFLEFIMFSRMFADSLDSLNNELSNGTTCWLGSSELEKKHCYCRMVELLVNVWAYHSARRMVYIDPDTGRLEEQHPIEERKGFMWVKFFNFTLLKSMDEDMAEAADDNDYPRPGWLWPQTGEVHWQGVYEREREGRYRAKMEKKRRTKEKLLERHKYGYRQKSLGGK